MRGHSIINFTTAFRVILNRSQMTLDVGKDDTILEVLEANAIQAAFSCKQGVCGTCETPVISGTPDHRDSFLSPNQQRSGKQMCLCVSRTNDQELILNL